MLARRGPGWYGTGPAGTALTQSRRGPDRYRPHRRRPDQQLAGSRPGRQRPDGRCRPVSHIFRFKLSQVSRSPHRPGSAGWGTAGDRRARHRPRSAIRRAKPLARQRPGGRGAGPGDLGTAGRGVNCWSPACRGGRGGRGPEL